MDPARRACRRFPRSARPAHRQAGHALRGRFGLPYGPPNAPLPRSIRAQCPSGVRRVRLCLRFLAASQASWTRTRDVPSVPLWFDPVQSQSWFDSQCGRPAARTTYGARSGSAGGSWTGAGLGSSVGVTGASSGSSGGRGRSSSCCIVTLSATYSSRCFLRASIKAYASVASLVDGRASLQTIEVS